MLCEGKVPGIFPVHQRIILTGYLTVISIKTVNYNWMPHIAEYREVKDKIYSKPKALYFGVHGDI